MLLRIESTRTPIVMRIVLTTVLVSSVIASLMNPVNPIAWLLDMRASHEQLLGWKRTGDKRAGRWEDTGEMGAWKITLPASVLIATIGGGTWLLHQL